MEDGAPELGSGGEDYFSRALFDYEAEHRMQLTLRHCWEVLKGSLKWMEYEVPKFLSNPQGSKRYKTSRSSSFNTESGDASINLNVDVGDDEEDEVQEVRRPMSRDQVKVSELAMHNERAIRMKKEEHLAFMEIKRREVECHKRELAMLEYRQRKEGIRFYMQPYDHLTRDALFHIEALRVEIKAK
ncbi:zinc finger BED domain-containing protein RICESLEEPER 2-like protein [Tanacetum coccineum]